MTGAATDFLGGPFGSQGAPGFLPPSATAGIAPAMGQSLGMMANRYSQLGLGTPGATPTSPGGGGPTTPELMDLGALPSLTGGIPGQFAAVEGQLQNALPSTPLGKSSSPASIINAIGRGTNLLTGGR